MFEYAGNAHMHTPYSDGIKYHAGIAQEAIKAGLDFIIVTDHNVWVDGVEGYYGGEDGRVLLLVGEEIHDMRRTPQANHFLAFGAERELSAFAPDPQRLIDETRNAGGYGFLAHPFDPAAPDVGEEALSWQDWGIDEYSGLEIWNYMSNFKGHLGNKLKSLRVALNPTKYITGPNPKALAKWDELLSHGKRVAVIGNSDAHGRTYTLGPLSRVIFPYEFLFRAINTHVLTDDELNGDLEHDKRLILGALGNGNGWIGYDMALNTTGFRFSGQGRSKGIMGDEINLDAAATLQVSVPTRCHIRLLRNGELMVEAHDETNLTHIPIEPGAYRVECTLPYLGKERGWIYSNPIYLRQ
jgi:hypothetical protein